MQGALKIMLLGGFRLYHQNRLIKSLASVTTGQVRYLNDLQTVTAQLRERLRELEAETHSQEDIHVS